MSIVGNWDDYEKIIHHTFYNELRISPEDYGLVLAEPPGNSIAAREKTVQIMFETFNVGAVLVANAATLAALGAGRRTALVVLAGLSCTWVVPVVNGESIEYASTVTGIGGRVIEDAFVLGLNNRKKDSVSTTSGKKQFCFHFYKHGRAPLNDAEIQNFKPIKIKEEGFEEIELGDELLAPGLFFTGSGEAVSLIAKIDEALHKVAPPLRMKLLSSIVLAGRPMQYAGIDERLLVELRKQTSFPEIKAETINVVKAKRPRDHLVSEGTKHFDYIKMNDNKSARPFGDRWISREEYERDGALIVHTNRLK